MSEQMSVEWYLDGWKERMGTLAEDMRMWELVQSKVDGESFRHISGLLVIVSFAEEEDGKVWQHLSASYRNRVPSHSEMVTLKNLFIGKDRYAYMVLPPEEFYVNLHPYCLHLWSRCDGPALPEFSGFLPGGKERSI